MNKLNRVKLSLMSVLFSSGMFLIGCNESSDVNLSNSAPYESAEFAFYKFDDAMNGIADASLDNEMGFHSYFNHPDFPRHDGNNFGHRERRGPKDRFHHKGRHLGRILWQLDLSEEQRNSVREFMEESRECLREPFAQFREAAKPYIEAANEERREIIQQVRDGEMTREEARELIKEINESKREEIENCPECVEARDAMCVCNLTLFDDIASLLNDDQLETWNEQTENLEGPCFD